MVLEDLHKRLESSGVSNLEIYIDGGDWRCQLFIRGPLEQYGEGSGPTIAFHSGG